MPVLALLQKRDKQPEVTLRVRRGVHAELLAADARPAAAPQPACAALQGGAKAPHKGRGGMERRHLTKEEGARSEGKGRGI